MVRVRFAPSPTGYLHVGGLRTALFNWLFARKEGGKFILRIEDTDRKRLVPGAVDNLLETLRWSGLDIDEGPEIGGEAGPYIQSQRLSIYRKHVETLLDAGKAYLCFCSPDELEEMRRRQREQGLSQIMYDGRCRKLAVSEAKERRERGEPCVVRMKVPRPEMVTVFDLVKGNVEFDSSTIDDQVLMKTDGYPTYHLASVVDDHLMGITHVIRGEEWLTSTPKHILLYRFFGWEPPHFAHLPLIFNQQRKKLSKRDGDVAVEAYRDKGFSPVALLNFLALLGWNAGDDKEFYPTLDSLIAAFSLERVHSSPAVFDFAKLKHINALHLRNSEPDEVADRLGQYLARLGWPVPGNDYLKRVFTLMKERVSLLPELAEQAPYFYKDPGEYEAKAVRKRWKADSPQLLEAYLNRLEALEAWDKEQLEAALREVAAERQVGAGKIIHPTRIAVSGVGGGPGLFEMMELLGKEVCVRRIRKALERIGKEVTA